MRMHAPFRYFGAKGRGIEQILKYFPENFNSRKCFVDLFGGSFVVSLNLAPQKCIYNDLDKRLVDFFWSIRGYPEVNDTELNIFGFNEEQLKIRKRELKKTYNLYYLLLSELKTATNSIDYLQRLEEMYEKTEDSTHKTVINALSFYIANRISWSGGSAVVETAPFGGKLANQFDTWHSVLENADWRIWNRDFRDAMRLINGYTTGEYWIYADPPYVKWGKGYKFSFEEQDHIDLHDCLVSSPHHWVLSYDDCDFVRDLYKGYTIEEVQWKYTCSGKESKTDHELIITSEHNRIDVPVRENVLLI